MRVVSYVAVGWLVAIAWMGWGIAGENGRQSAQGAEGPDGSAVRMNRVIALFRENKPAFGIFSYARSARNAAALSTSGLDFVLVDMEHGAVDFETLQRFLLAMVDKRRALEKGNAQPDVVPLVRLPQNGRERLQFLIKQALDLGAYGLMLPHIDSPEDALAAVRAARYAQRTGVPDREPVGHRGVSYGFAARVWGVTPAQYLRQADVWPLDPDGEILLILQIESTRGVSNVEQILAVPGVGAVFVGPADLAMSLGVEMDDPQVEHAAQRVLKAALARGVPCGITATEKNAEERLGQGFRFLTLGNDLGPGAGASAALRAARGVTHQDQ
ncbi:MAG: HpcH/HpaI aldolase/citrate lyase family protein [Pirellulales bacterium]